MKTKRKVLKVKRKENNKRTYRSVKYTNLRFLKNLYKYFAIKFLSLLNTLNKF